MTDLPSCRHRGRVIAGVCSCWSNRFTSKQGRPVPTDFCRDKCGYVDRENRPSKGGRLGDWIAAAARVTGAATLALWWEKVTGVECGCDGRRAKLNHAHERFIRWLVDHWRAWRARDD